MRVYIDYLRLTLTYLLSLSDLLLQATAELVEKAIKAGFRHIDTACQPRHYKESGVGDGWKASGIDRKDIWLQTKFSGLGAHVSCNLMIICYI